LYILCICIFLSFLFLCLSTLINSELNSEVEGWSCLFSILLCLCVCLFFSLFCFYVC
jgi:hypothetical protein